MALLEIKVDNRPLQAANIFSQLAKDKEEANKAGKDLTYSYFLIHGEDQQLKNEALDAVQEFATSAKGYGCNEVVVFTDSDKFDVKELLLEVNSYGFLEIRRFYKFVFNQKPTPKLLKDLSTLVEAGDALNIYCFVFANWLPNLLKSDFYHHLNALDSNNKLPYPVKGAFINVRSKLGDNFKRMINSRLKVYNFQFKPEVVDYLAQMFENNLIALMQLLDQLKLREIDNLTIEVISTASDQLSDFTVNDFILNVAIGNIQRSFDVMHYLIDKKKLNPSVMIFHLRILLQNIYRWRQPVNAYSAQDFMLSTISPQGTFDPTSDREIGFLCKWDKHRIHVVKDYLMTKLSRQRLYKLMNLLSEIDFQSKTHSTFEQNIANIKKFVYAYNLDSNIQEYELYNDLYTVDI